MSFFEKKIKFKKAVRVSASARLEERLEIGEEIKKKNGF